MTYLLLGNRHPGQVSNTLSLLSFVILERQKPVGHKAAQICGHTQTPDVHILEYETTRVPHTYWVSGYAPNSVPYTNYR